MSLLEQRLLEAPQVNKCSEWQIDILRSVLRNEIGTPNQRNALLRIIKVHKIRGPVLIRLLPQFGIQAPPRTEYGPIIRTTESEEPIISDPPST